MYQANLTLFCCSPLQWFRKQAYPNNYTNQVVHFLERSTAKEDMDIETISKNMHMTSRTLRRKLINEGQHFQQIKDNIRRDQAIHFLGNSQLTIAQVGRLIWFSEPAAFTRAFTQWTGVSPSLYRKKLHQP